MKKETKESITKELVERMNKNLLSKKTISGTKQSDKLLQKLTTENGRLSKEEFYRVAAYYMTHAEDPIEILFCDLNNAYDVYTDSNRAFHVTMVGIINEFKEAALKTFKPNFNLECCKNDNGKQDKGDNVSHFKQDDLKVCGVERVFEECIELYKRKNHDYSNKGESAFDKAYKKMGAKSLWLRLNDKFTRFESLLFSDDAPQVSDEKIEDTLLDLINYAAMGLAKLKGYK